jgi:hypothetical protein
MLTKESAEKIATSYYQLGQQLALEEAGLTKVAGPKNPKVSKKNKGKATFGRMQDINPPKEQQMSFKSKKITPTDSFKKIRDIPDSDVDKGIVRGDRKKAMRKYLENSSTLAGGKNLGHQNLLLDDSPLSGKNNKELVDHIKNLRKGR